MFFRGSSLRSLDPKGRLMLPPEFRELVQQKSEGSQIVLTTYDKCVVVFMLSEWEEFEKKLAEVATPVLQVRDHRRRVIGSAEVMAIDAQGRVRLTPRQLAYAGIEKEALVVGTGRRFEIWSPERFDELVNQDIDDVATALAESGISFDF